MNSRQLRVFAIFLSAVLLLAPNTNQHPVYATKITYTSGTTDFVVPAGVTTVTIKLWGAGGTSDTGGGGAGGFAQADITVSAGQTYKVVVGAVNGGGAAGSASNNPGSSGGGYSGLFLTSIAFANAKAIAGGGGGGAGCNSGGAGGGGGGTTGEQGYPQSGSYLGGGGGTQVGGGSTGGGGSGGSELTGGQSGSGNSYSGGGGGAGYYGGGSGKSSSTCNQNTGGGGGSGYVSGTNTTLLQNCNTGDTDYVSGKCSVGSIGYAVLSYTVNSSPQAVTYDVNESDGSTAFTSGSVINSNSSSSMTIALNSTGHAKFTGLNGLQNVTVMDSNNLVLKKTYNLNATSIGNSTSSMNVNRFYVDCPSNGAGNDIIIYVNDTDGHRQSSFTTPTCDSLNRVIWNVTETGNGRGSAQSFLSKVIIEVLNTHSFGINPTLLTRNGTTITTTYSTSTSKATSSTFTVGTPYQNKLEVFYLTLASPTFVTITGDLNENDGTTAVTSGSIRQENGTTSTTKTLDGSGQAVFQGLQQNQYQNFTGIDQDLFVIFKQWNYNATADATLTMSGKVYRVDCPSNGAGVDVIIKVNNTNVHLLTSTTPSCNASDDITWIGTFTKSGKASTSANATSSMIAEIVNATAFGENADLFTENGTTKSTSYASSKITSTAFQVGSAFQTRVLNFALYLSKINAPYGVSTTPASTTQIDLSWSAPSGTIAGYKIWKSTDGTTYSVVVSDTGSSGTTYSATGLSASTLYYFKIAGIISGVLTDNSTGVNSYTIPAAPTSLTAIGISSSQINLSWSAPSGTISGYKIERESPIGNGFSTLVANTGTTSTSYSDTGLSASTSYNYRVSAINPSATSAASTAADSSTLVGGGGISGGSSGSGNSFTPASIVSKILKTVIIPNRYFADVGQRISGEFIISWTLPGDLTITSAIAKEHASWITLDDTEPVLRQMPSGTKEGTLKYVIQLPNVICPSDDQVSDACIQKKEYTIPVEITSSVGTETTVETQLITIDLRGAGNIGTVMILGGAGFTATVIVLQATHQTGKIGKIMTTRNLSGKSLSRFPSKKGSSLAKRLNGKSLSRFPSKKGSSLAKRLKKIK